MGLWAGSSRPRWLRAGIHFHDCRPLSLVAISAHLLTLCQCYQPGLKRLMCPNLQDLLVGCFLSLRQVLVPLAETLPFRGSAFFTSLPRYHRHLWGDPLGNARWKGGKLKEGGRCIWLAPANKKPSRIDFYLGRALKCCLVDGYPGSLQSQLPHI